MHKFIITIIILLSSPSLAQSSCITRPSCEELGYTQSATDCANKKSLRCPFDMTAYLCAELGGCDFSAYPLTSCPTGGNCSNITCDGTTKYKLNSCNSGYTQSGNTCTCDFSSYPLSSCPTGGNCSNYSCGGTTKYKLNSCNSGYTQSGNACNLNCDFTNYPLSSCPTGGNCSNYSCGGTTKYKLDSCNSGYTQSGDTCTCNWGSYTLSSCPTNGNCTSKTCGGTKKYKLNSCKSGYTKSGNTCVYDPCSGYYECGGAWQYCEGYTCSADSSMCSEYCVDDYFPNECDNEDYCDGVYRDGYCSGECDEPDCSACIDESSCATGEGYSYNSTCGCYTRCCTTTYTDCAEYCANTGTGVCYTGTGTCACVSTPNSGF